MITTIQLKAVYKPIRKMNTGKYIIMIKLEDLDETSCRVCQGLFNYIDLANIKRQVFNIINEETKTNIIEHFYYKGKQVWLSEINQFNYKAAYDLALDLEGDNLPYIIKTGEEDKAEYLEIETIKQFEDFYFSMINHIQTCQKEAWKKKDSIDWSIYEEELNKLYDTGRTQSPSGE